MSDVSIFDILVIIAGTTFVLGWLLVIADAIGGFRLIENLPTRIVDTFGSIHDAAWVSIGLVLLALAVVRLSGV